MTETASFFYGFSAGGRICLSPTHFFKQFVSSFSLSVFLISSSTSAELNEREAAVKFRDMQFRCGRWALVRSQAYNCENCQVGLGLIRCLQNCGRYSSDEMTHQNREYGNTHD